MRMSGTVIIAVRSIESRADNPLELKRYLPLIEWRSEWDEIIRYHASLKQAMGGMLSQCNT